MATLVRAVDDIRTRSRKPGAGATAPSQGTGVRRTASIALVVVAAVAGAWPWMFTRSSAEPIVSPTQEQQSTVSSDPASAVTPASDTAAHAPVATPIDAQPERSTPPAVNYVGTLSIDAAPGGEVLIDRWSAGRTPLRLTNLKAGSHLIWIERDGYSRWTRVVQVPSDRVTRLWADLEPLPSR